MREKIIMELGIERQKVGVDLFASERDAQEPLFMTELNSAWFYNWQGFCQNGKVLWANPPFEDIKKVLKKSMPVAMQNDPRYTNVEGGKLGALVGENCREAIGNPPWCSSF